MSASGSSRTLWVDSGNPWLTEKLPHLILACPS
jgi:hypothetical protein